MQEAKSPTYRKVPRFRTGCLAFDGQDTLLPATPRVLKIYKYYSVGYLVISWCDEMVLLISLCSAGEKVSMKQDVRASASRLSSHAMAAWRRADPEIMVERPKMEATVFLRVPESVETCIPVGHQPECVKGTHPYVDFLL